MYLTYTEYVAFGGTLDEVTFGDLEFSAEKLVDYVTFNRLVGETELPSDLKRLMYHIIGIVQKKNEAMSLGKGEESASSGYITSQSNDGVSISYNGMSATDLFTLCDKDIQDSIRKFLFGLKNSKGRSLLYRGLYPGE